MAIRASTFAAKSLPWLAALAYVWVIAQLGLSFQRIKPFEIARVQELSSQAATRQIDLPFIEATGQIPASASLMLQFPAADADTQLAFFFPRLASDAKFSVNGILIRPQSHSSRPKQINRPLLVPVPGQLLRSSQNNELLIELLGYEPSMFLSRFYLGPQVELEPVFRYFHFFQHDLIRIAFTVTSLIALFMGTIWWVRRQFNEYGWLSLAFLAFSYYLYNYVGTSVSDHYELLTWSFLVARAIFICSFLLFVHQFLNLRRRWLERSAIAFFSLIFTIGLVLVLADGYRDFLTLTYFTSLPMLLLLIGYVCVLLAVALIKSGHVYLHWMFVGSLLGLILGIHDLFVLFDAQHWLFRDFFISHYASLFMAIGFGGVLVHRIAHALFNSEDLNLELNRLLEIKSIALENASLQRLQHEKQLALHAERQRIMSDMHDGVGGQLVGLIAASRDGRLESRVVNDELERILADLRLVLDALTPAGEELLASLARLRERYSVLLRSAGCELHWQIDPDIDVLPMPPSCTINVLRLVQEAIQNCLKHAHAKSIQLRLSPFNEGFRLSIRDDGIGIQAQVSESPGGLGRQSMLRRAQAVGADLEIGPSPEGGTEVILSLSTLPTRTP